MKESFTPDEELVLLYLKRQANSTKPQIAENTGLKQRGAVASALDGLHAKGMLGHTDDTDQRYYLIHTG